MIFTLVMLGLKNFSKSLELVVWGLQKRRRRTFAEQCGMLMFSLMIESLAHETVIVL